MIGVINQHGLEFSSSFHVFFFPPQNEFPEASLETLLCRQVDR